MRTLQDSTVPAQSPILLAPAPFSEAMFLILLQFAINNLISKQDTIDQLENAIVQYEGAAHRSKEAFAALSLKLRPVIQRLESQQDVIRKLALEKSNLKWKQSTIKDAQIKKLSKSLKDANITNGMLNDQLEKEEQTVKNFHSIVAVREQALRTAHRVYLQERKNLATAQEDNKSYAKAQAENFKLFAAWQQQYAALQKSHDHWHGQFTIAHKACNNERAAHAKTQAKLDEMQQANADLISGTHQLLEEKADKDATHEKEILAKDFTISLLEQEVARLRAEQTSRSRNASDPFSTSNAPFSEDEKVSPASSSPPSSYHGDVSGDDGHDKSDQITKENATQDNHDQDMHAASTQADPATHNFSFSFGGDNNPFASSPPGSANASPSPPPRAETQQRTSASPSIPTQTTNRPVIKQAKRSSGRASSIPTLTVAPSTPVVALEAETGKRYSMKGADLSANAIDIYSPVDAASPLGSAPTADAYYSSADVEMVDAFNSDDFPAYEAAAGSERNARPEAIDKKGRKVKTFKGRGKLGRGKVVKMGKNAMGVVEPFVPKAKEESSNDEAGNVVDQDLKIANKKSVGDEAKEVPEATKKDAFGNFEEAAGGMATFNFSVQPDVNPFSWT